MSTKFVQVARVMLAGVVMLLLVASQPVNAVSSRVSGYVSFYVTVTGARQGVFQGEGTTDQFAAAIPGYKYNFNLDMQHSPYNGVPLGRRQESEVVFTKQFGAASPQFLQAMVNNEVLPTVLFQFVHTNMDGTEEVYHTIKLINATITAVHQHFASDNNLSTKGFAQEDISMTFQRIEVQNLSSGTAGADDWR